MVGVNDLGDAVEMFDLARDHPPLAAGQDAP
jgi:hypothetical protein